jgi:hypothetical protein
MADMGITDVMTAAPLSYRAMAALLPDELFGEFDKKAERLAQGAIQFGEPDMGTDRLLADGETSSRRSHFDPMPSTNGEGLSTGRMTLQQALAKIKSLEALQREGTKLSDPPRVTLNNQSESAIHHERTQHEATKTNSVEQRVS